MTDVKDLYDAVIIGGGLLGSPPPSIWPALATVSLAREGPFLWTDHYY